MADKLDRFRTSHRDYYDEALREIKNGRKNGHWMWYIFPQLSGLGMSATSLYYGIRGLGEAKEYLADPMLGEHLVEISAALLEIPTDDPRRVFWFPDDLKLCSCMTLFAVAAPDEPVFRKVIDKFFGGKPDSLTLDMLGAEY